MDTKRLMMSVLVAVALTFILMRFFPGNAGKPAAAALTNYAAYKDFKALASPEQDKTRPHEGDAVPETREIGNIGEGSKEKLQVTVSNVMAGVDRVQINPAYYSQTVNKKDPLTLFAATPELPRPFSTVGVHVTLQLAHGAAEVPFSPKLTDSMNGSISTLSDYAKSRPLAADEKDDLAALTAIINNPAKKSVNELLNDFIATMRTRDLLPTEAVQFKEMEKFVAFTNATCLLDTQYVWQFEPAAGAGKTAMSISLDLAGKPLVKVIKTFAVNPATYEVTVTHEVWNFGDDSLLVSVDQMSAPQLARDDPSYDDRYFMGVPLVKAKEYVDSDHTVDVSQATLPRDMVGGLDAATGVTNAGGTKYLGQMNDFDKANANNPLVWTATGNRFFTIMVRPLDGAGLVAGGNMPISGAAVAIPQVHHVGAVNVDLLQAAAKPEDNIAGMRLTGAPVPVGVKAAGTAYTSVSEPLSVYMGPKKREILEADATQNALQYQKVIKYQAGCYSFCVKDLLVIPILWLLDFFKTYVTFGNYGLAIMVLVIVVRLALHPLTRSGQISMAKMSKQMRDVAPKIESMKKKYADDRKKQSEEMMRIYKENNINPAGSVMGCLPMALQIPIWVALTTGLRLDIDLRHAAFIPGWINDLSNPDRIFPATMPVLGHPMLTIPLVNFPIYGLNLLPILLGVVLLINMKVMAASQPPPADESQARAQKMSQYLVLIMPFAFYNAAAGSNLYIFASTLAGLVDTYFVRKTLRKRGILPANAKDLPTKEA